MNILLYVLYISMFLFEYLSVELNLLSRYLTYIPELLSVLTMLIIVARVTVGYGKNFPSICSFFLVLFLSNIALGIVINHVPAGPLIAGSRTYLKFIPFFILPFIYHFSSEQINKQLKLLLIFFMIQAPVALYQRLVISKGLITGDFVKGTIGGSGILTVILVCAIAILLTFYLTKKIKFTPFIIMFLLLFLPMTMNETKASIILLPIAFILPIYFSSSNINLKQFIPLITFIALSGVMFISVYDHFVSSQERSGVMDFLSDSNRMEHYLYKGSTDGYKPPDTEHSKIDSYIIAYVALSENILHLLFGLGIGNVSESFLPSLSGVYAEKYSSYDVHLTSLTLILWELGISGVILYYLLFFMTFKYSKRLSIQDSFIGYFSNGWATVSIIIMISTLYTSVFTVNTLGYLYWYFSGYVISENFRYKL